MPALRFFLCATAVLTLAVAAAAAAETGPAPRTVCVFPFADLSGRGSAADPPSVSSPEEADRAQSLFSAVSAELSAARFKLMAEGDWRAKPGNADLTAEDFLDPAATVRTAGSAGADIAVSGFYSLQEDRILISVSCYDTRSGDLAAGFMKTWRYNLGLYSALHGEIRSLVERLDAASLSSPTDGAPVPRVALLPALTFTSAQEGMEVVLAGGKSAGRISGGKLVLAAPGTLPGQALTVEKRLAGYHTAWQEIKSAPVIALTPLARAANMALETDWTFGQLIGAGGAFRLYFVPDYSFASVSLYPYAQAPASAWGNWLVHVDSELSVGSYLFFKPDSLLRMGASTGAGLIYSLIPGGNPSSYFDAYLNVFSLWAELNLGRLSFFIRPEMKFSLGVFTPNLLGRTFIISGNVFPPVTLGALYKW